MDSNRPTIMNFRGPAQLRSEGLFYRAQSFDDNIIQDDFTDYVYDNISVPGGDDSGDSDDTIFYSEEISVNSPDGDDIILIILDHLIHLPKISLSLLGLILEECKRPYKE